MFPLLDPRMLTILLLLMYLELIIAFRPNARGIRHSLQKSPLSAVEDGVNLSALTNFESDGNFLKESIRKYLDEEFIPLSIHEDIVSTFSSSMSPHLLLHLSLQTLQGHFC